jgi:hypothetical protein
LQIHGDGFSWISADICAYPGVSMVSMDIQRMFLALIHVL